MTQCLKFVIVRVSDCTRVSTTQNLWYPPPPHKYLTGSGISTRMTSEVGKIPEFRKISCLYHTTSSTANTCASVVTLGLVDKPCTGKNGVTAWPQNKPHDNQTTSMLQEVVGKQQVAQPDD